MTMKYRDNTPNPYVSDDDVELDPATAAQYERDRREDDTPKAPDFEFVEHGSICLLTPMTPAANDWDEANIPKDADRWGACSVVDRAALRPIHPGRHCGRRLNCGAILMTSAYRSRMDAENLAAAHPTVQDAAKAHPRLAQVDRAKPLLVARSRIRQGKPLHVPLDPRAGARTGRSGARCSAPASRPTLSPRPTMIKPKTRAAPDRGERPSCAPKTPSCSRCWPKSGLALSKLERNWKSPLTRTRNRTICLITKKEHAK